MNSSKLQLRDACLANEFSSFCLCDLREEKNLNSNAILQSAKIPSKLRLVSDTLGKLYLKPAEWRLTCNVC